MSIVVLEYATKLIYDNKGVLVVNIWQQGEWHLMAQDTSGTLLVSWAIKCHLCFPFFQETVECMLPKWVDKTKKRVWISLKWTLGFPQSGMSSRIMCNIASGSPCKKGVIVINEASHLWEKWELPSVQSDLMGTWRTRLSICPAEKACIPAFRVGDTAVVLCTHPPGTVYTARKSWESNHSGLRLQRARPDWCMHFPGGKVRASGEIWGSDNGPWRWRGQQVAIVYAEILVCCD